jgi:hypothetical protein
MNEPPRGKPRGIKPDFRMTLPAAEQRGIVDPQGMDVMRV